MKESTAKKELKEQKEIVARLEDEINQLKSASAAPKEKEIIVRLEDEIDQLKSNIAAKSAGLKEKENIIKDAEARIKNLENHVSHKLTEIEELRKTKAELEKNNQSRQRPPVVMVKEVPKEIFIEKIVERIVEKPIEVVIEKEVIVEKIVEKEKIVEVIKEVFVDKPVEVFVAKVEAKGDMEGFEVLMEEMGVIKKQRDDLKARLENASGLVMRKGLEVDAFRKKFREMADICNRISETKVNYSERKVPIPPKETKGNGAVPDLPDPTGPREVDEVIGGTNV